MHFKYELDIRTNDEKVVELLERISEIFKRELVEYVEDIQVMPTVTILD